MRDTILPNNKISASIPVEGITGLVAAYHKFSLCPSCTWWFSLILMQPERLDDDVIHPDDATQSPDELGAEVGGVVGELDAVTAISLEDLQRETGGPRGGETEG